MPESGAASDRWLGLFLPLALFQLLPCGEDMAGQSNARPSAESCNEIPARSLLCDVIVFLPPIVYRFSPLPSHSTATYSYLFLSITPDSPSISRPPSPPSCLGLCRWRSALGAAAMFLLPSVQRRSSCVAGGRAGKEGRQMLRLSSDPPPPHLGYSAGVLVFTLWPTVIRACFWVH